MTRNSVPIGAAASQKARIAQARLHPSHILNIVEIKRFFGRISSCGERGRGPLADAQQKWVAYPALTEAALQLLFSTKILHFEP
jgi:hypothetical protein